MRTGEILDQYLKKTYIYQYKERDRKHPYNRKYDAIQEFNGLVHNRRTTDKPFLIILVLIIAGFIGFTSTSLRRFNLHRLLKPQDFRGDYCGVGHLEKEKYVYWPNPLEWGFYVKSCLETCPSKNNEEICFYDEFNKSFYEDYCFLTLSTSVS